MKTHLYISILCMTIFLSACGTKQTPRQTPPPAPETQEKARTPEELISQASKQQEPRKKYQLLTNAAESYCESQLLSQCLAIINDIDSSFLDISSQAKLLKMNILIAEHIEAPERIISTFYALPAQVTDSLPIETQGQILLSLNKAYVETDQYINAALTILEHIGLYPEEQHDSLYEAAWQQLRTANTNELTQFIYTGANSDSLAWLDLAKAIQLNQINLDQQYTAYQSWKALWPEHPGSLTPPKELEILDILPHSKPDSITLALPLSGPLGEPGRAIRDGFIAAHFANSSNQNQTSHKTNSTEIHFFDTHQQDILELYELQLNGLQLNQEKNLIVGPLDKPSLNKLYQSEEISIPTLALNYLENYTTKENLFLFGLSPEGEAIQVAQQLKNKNHQRVAVIAPESDFGFRVYDSFANSFSEIDGLLIESAFYGQQTTFADTVAELLGTKKSKERKRKVQSITGEKFEFFPRRRQDIDAIFMVAKPETAKQLKPLFAYNYAADIPVFSISQVNKVNNIDKNRDLDNIRFLEMPWMLSNTNPIKATISNTYKNPTPTYSRFHALGADAYNLVPRLKLLSEVKDSQVQGHTGTLRMTENGIISSELEWATFRKGKAIPMRE